MVPILEENSGFRKKRESLMAFGLKSQSNSSYFFVGCRKILMSYSADGIKRPSQLVPESEEPICIVVGAIAKVNQYYPSWLLIQLLSVIIPGRHRD